MLASFIVVLTHHPVHEAYTFRWTPDEAQVGLAFFDSHRPDLNFAGAGDDRLTVLDLSSPGESAADRNGQTIEPAGSPDAKSDFVITNGDRFAAPSSRRPGFEHGLLWILAASVAAHFCVLTFLLWFSPEPLEADRRQETPVEVVVETPPPKPPENPAPAPQAQKAAAEAHPEGPNPPEPKVPEAKPLAANSAASKSPEAKPLEAAAAEAKPPASRPPEEKREKAKAAPSKSADQQGGTQKPGEEKRAEDKPAPAQAKASARLAAAQREAPHKDLPRTAAPRQVANASAADKWNDLGSKSPALGGLRLPFDNGPDIFRAVAVPLPVEGGDEPMSYKEIVFGLLERAKQYPESARERGARGTAVVSFAIDDAGELTDASVLQSSGEADLDAESLALVARAAPFPRPPLGAQRAFAAEITFGLQRKE